MGKIVLTLAGTEGGLVMGAMIDDRKFLHKLATMKVLVVDDQSNMVRTLSGMLTAICLFKNRTESIKRAYNGNDALSIILNQPDPKNPIDLVLLDWNMPFLPGIEVLRGIRSSEEPFVRDVPIIMITGEAHSDDVNNAVHEGANTYLLKPVLLNDLKDRMIPLVRKHWSKIKIQRGENRRKEIRYPGNEIGFVIEIEFASGGVIKPTVINISNSGIRLDLKGDERRDIKSIIFPTKDGDKDEKNRVDTFPVERLENDESPKSYVGISLKDGFESEDIEARWVAWVDRAKEKYQSYRGQSA